MRSKKRAPEFDNLRFISEFAKMAASAAGSFGDFKDQFKDILRDKIEDVMDRMDLVTREEFDRVEAIATRARARQEELEERLAVLEGKKTAGDKKPAKKKPAKKTVKKTSAKPAKKKGKK